MFLSNSKGIITNPRKSRKHQKRVLTRWWRMATAIQAAQGQHSNFLRTFSSKRIILIPVSKLNSRAQIPLDIIRQVTRALRLRLDWRTLPHDWSAEENSIFNFPCQSFYPTSWGSFGKLGRWWNKKIPLGALKHNFRFTQIVFIVDGSRLREIK